MPEPEKKPRGWHSTSDVDLFYLRADYRLYVSGQRVMCVADATSGLTNTICHYCFEYQFASDGSTADWPARWLEV